MAQIIKKGAPITGAPANKEQRLVAVLFRTGFGGVHHAEAAATIGVDKHQRIFSGLHVAQLALGFVSALYRFAVDLLNHVAAGETGIIGRAAGNDVGYNHALDVAGKVKFVAHIRREVLQAYAPARLALSLGRAGVSFLRVLADRSKSQRNAHVLAVAEDAEVDLVPGTVRADGGLKLAGVLHVLAVEFGNDIANFNSRFAGGRIGLNLAYVSAPRAVSVG